MNKNLQHQKFQHSLFKKQIKKLNQKKKKKQIKKLNQNKNNKFYHFFLIMFITSCILIKYSFSDEKNIQIECKTEKISKKFTFLYIPKRNRIIWVQEGREMKVNKKENNQINFTGYGVYGLGYDSWFRSNLFFEINLENGNFKLTADNNIHRDKPQSGKCFNKKFSRNNKQYYFSYLQRVNRTMSCRCYASLHNYGDTVKGWTDWMNDLRRRVRGIPRISRQKR